LRDVAGTLGELREMADSLGDAFLRVTVKAAEPMPGLAEQVKELLPHALDVTVEHPRNEPVDGDGHAPRTQLEPAELFAGYYERKNGRPPSEDLRKLFRDLYDEARR
jgi:hypothetical protein